MSNGGLRTSSILQSIFPRSSLWLENIPLPDTYKELVANVSLVPGFDKERMKFLSEWVRFRNIIAHEYLDIRWASIRKFIQESEPLYTSFLKDAKEYLDKQLQTDTAKT